MARRHELTYALNAGGVDPEAVARVDMEKMRIAGEHPVDNWLPRVLGPMTLRPGTENLVQTDQARVVRFVRSVGTSYLLVFSGNTMRVLHNGQFVQVPDVATRINSGSWTNESTSPATATGGASLALTASDQSSAILRQQLTVATGDRNTVHVLRVVVSRGPVILRVGTTAGGEERLEDAYLDTGTHKIAFTPNDSPIFVEIRSDYPADLSRVVSQIQFEAAFSTGDLTLPTPWPYATLNRMRTEQSIDVLFVGDGINQQRRIEHRGPQSWGISLYRSDNGPFVPGDSRLTLDPNGQTGAVDIAASESFFRPQHAGALIEMTHSGVLVETTFNAVDQVSDHITVIGLDSSRLFLRRSTGSSFVGTIVLERSFDPGTPIVWASYLTFANGDATFPDTSVNDGQDNLVVHYRFRCSAYTSGTVDVRLRYVNDRRSGVARILTYTNKRAVVAEVLSPFGLSNATRDWRIGDWSGTRGWPRVPVIHDSRLHWFRGDTDYASAVDDYSNFSDEIEGDSGPIIRSVGAGGEDGVLWALSLDRLIVGTAAFEAIITASELDEALTPTSYTVRKPSRRGCADIPAVSYDDGLFFVQRSGRKVYEMSVSPGTARMRSVDVSRLNPAAFRAGVLRLAVQQQPDTRLYAVLADGTLAVMTYERQDEVVAITRLTFPGATVEDIEVLPGTTQDEVYLVMNRSGTRYIERFGQEAAQTSVSTCTLLDAHRVLTGSVSSITGATHLAGQTVQVWADGQRRANVTLDGSGNGALGATYSRVVYGLAFTAEYKSVKLAHAAQLGTAVGQTKIIKGLGVSLYNSCLDGLTMGSDLARMEPMPLEINGAARTANQFFAHYDAEVFPVDSEWTPDARFYISANSAEGPCTVQAVVVDIETRDGAASGNG